MSEFQTPPLKRHESLQPLSRDHYVGLVQGRHLMKAAEGNGVDRRGALATFLDVWDMEISEHFADEERLLAPLADEPGRTRMLQEHDRIRQMVEEGRQRRREIDPGAAWMAGLGQMLTDHIRWEERELFPSIEQAAPAKLDDLREEAEQIEASRPRGRRRA